MSRNKNLEEKIEVVDDLVKEMRNHRDQARAFKGAADALQVMNTEIKALDKQFEGLNADASHDRLEAIERQRDGIRDQLAEFKGEFKGLVDSLSARVGTLKDDVSGLGSAMVSTKEASATHLGRIEAQNESALESLAALNKETTARLGETSQKTHELIQKADTESRIHASEINKETLKQLKDENEAMKAMIRNHFATMQKWVTFVAIVGVLAAGGAGYLLYLSLEAAV